MADVVEEGLLGKRKDIILQVLQVADAHFFVTCARLAENESTASGVPYSPQFHTPETVSFAPADDFADAAAQRNTDFPTKSAGESASASCAPAENDASAQANPYVRIERR